MLLCAVFCKGQAYYSNGQLPTYKKFVPYRDKDGGIFLDTSAPYTPKIDDRCCTIQSGDHMPFHLIKLNAEDKQKIQALIDSAYILGMNSAFDTMYSTDLKCYARIRLELDALHKEIDKTF